MVFIIEFIQLIIVFMEPTLFLLYYLLCSYLLIFTPLLVPIQAFIPLSLPFPFRLQVLALMEEEEFILFSLLSQLFIYFQVKQVLVEVTIDLTPPHFIHFNYSQNLQINVQVMDLIILQVFSVLLQQLMILLEQLDFL